MTKWFHVNYRLEAAIALSLLLLALSSESAPNERFRHCKPGESFARFVHEEKKESPIYHSHDTTGNYYTCLPCGICENGLKMIEQCSEDLDTKCSDNECEDAGFIYFNDVEIGPPQCIPTSQNPETLPPLDEKRQPCGCSSDKHIDGLIIFAVVLSSLSCFISVGALAFVCRVYRKHPKRPQLPSKGRCSQKLMDSSSANGREMAPLTK